MYVKLSGHIGFKSKIGILVQQVAIAIGDVLLHHHWVREGQEVILKSLYPGRYVREYAHLA